ncbi:hypothetical protein ZIOFF_050791 [Zingiber officinale]|uniref:Uncharacterized protein n=1 Tax=Zingiber officinale TaxID=94328 RepID=A0A8J5FLP3_ZINOF|nr:hypothetical protein ZIOFF_050791 [Zingiber officinale]
MSTARPPAVSTTSTIQVPSVEDHIRDYRTNQRRLYNMQRRLMPSQRRFRRTIESQINPEEQLELSRSRRADMVLAEGLYLAGFRPTQHRVYQHYSEEDILCVEENQTDLTLVTQQSHQALRGAGFHHIHMALVMIRIYALHRRNTGAMGYTPIPEDKEVRRTNHDDVEITSLENEILAMIREEFPEALYVTKMDPNAIIP